MDNNTPEQRRKNMKAVKNKDSEIERLLRKELWSRGLRYRKNYKKIIGKPDIVFVGKKVAVFCDSEFWHGYDWENKKNEIQSRREFWIPKIERNMQRDIEVTQTLENEGWTVLRFWGNDIKKKTKECADIIERAVTAKMKVFRSIDLFAGIGGIRLGFERAFKNQIETVFVSEWDEYVFLRLLATGKLFAADADLNKISGTFYNILNILRNENGQQLEFHVDSNRGCVSVVDSDTNVVLISLPFGDFEKAADELYGEIIAAKSPSFSVIATETFLNNIRVYSLKAKSTDKSDIRTKVHDINTGIDIVQGFSIKSRLGSPSTLINAGKTTNFIYEVTGPMTDSIMKDFNSCSKLFKNRFAVLNANKCDISYFCMENSTFENNLLLLDGNLPEICAEMLTI